MRYASTALALGVRHGLGGDLVAARGEPFCCLCVEDFLEEPRVSACAGGRRPR